MTTMTVEQAKKIAKWMLSAQTVAAVLSLARSDPRLAATVDQWDRDPFLLGGAMYCDLRTGELKPPEPLDYITKVTAIAAAAPGTPHPLWSNFLERITASDQELQRYLQRVAGYCLTGSIKEHVLFFLYGGGANGKSVFINTLIGIWNDYALTIGTDMLMVSNTDRHPTEIARLRGARLAVGSEVEIGRTWAESKIKGLTGGDRLQGRYMRQDFFEFDPQFKLMIVGNHKPSLRGVDEAIRRRLHLIPFTVTIPTAERDRDLPEKLKAEWPAILRWAIDGCLEWQRQGLNPPAAVCEATKDYLASEDTLGQWIGERCVLSPAIDWTSVKCLYDDWRDWAMTRGNHPGSTKSFSQRLDERGFERKTRNKGPGFLGIGLAQEQAGTGQGERSERSPYNGRIDGVFARMRGQDPKSESLYAYYKSNSHFSNPCPDDVADQGREPLGICPVCRFTVCRDNAVQTGGGAWLHPACLRR